MMELRGLRKWAIFIALALTLVWGMTFAFSSVKAASGNDYYVALNGDDSNSGSLEQPWRTIQKAANTMVAGDSVVVLAGEYGERVQITTSGASGAPITYRAEGTVTMKGFTIKADYILIQGYDITDTEDSWGEGLGIFVEGSHCVLEDNYVYFATRGGILLSAATSDCKVQNNRLYRNAMAGIELHGRNHLIEGNEIWGTIQYHPKWKNPPDWVDADGFSVFGSGHMIRGNYVHDITYDDPENVNPHIDCFQSWTDSYHEAASDVIFEQNICTVLESQVIRENGHGFMLADTHRLIIRNNIIQAFGGINTGSGGNSDLTIVNNIFASNLSFPLDRFPAGIVLWSCPNTVIKNNIFYNQPYDTILVGGDTSGQEIDYNLAYRSDGQSSSCYEIDWRCVDPAPIHHLWDVDPLFVDAASGDFHLREGSPAIDAGISLAEVINDFDGNIRPYGWSYDIGAFEYAGDVLTPTFSDVPFDHWAHDYIEELYQLGYIAGCSTDPLMYCPEAIMSRAESAVFVERGLHGGGYLPDYPERVIFDDVPLTDWYAKWVTALWNDGYTAGCSTNPLVYCPMEEHTRAEGAVFFLRMLNGADYVPPDPKGIFVDAPLDMWYTGWVEAAYHAGLIPVCDTEPDLRICPEDPLTRDMGAYMMFQAKGLESP